jgi:hypothetical protein
VLRLRVVRTAKIEMSSQVRVWEIVIGGCTYLLITTLRISLEWVPFDENRSLSTVLENFEALERVHF